MAQVGRRFTLTQVCCRPASALRWTERCGGSLETGSFKFYVEMREPQDDPTTCAGKRTPKQFTLRIRAQPSIISTPAIPLGLPTGLRLHADGSIAGTPRVAGTYRFVARARDTESRSVNYPVTLDITPRLHVPAPRTPAGKLGRRYNANLAAIGGVGPTRWKLVAGRLPSGIRLAASSGTLTGTPRETGTHVVKVKPATD